MIRFAEIYWLKHAKMKLIEMWNMRFFHLVLSSTIEVLIRRLEYIH